jgi:hypothetical protein
MRSIAIILILSGALLSIHSAYVSVDFLQRQEFIAQELCENKDQPELNCEGRCYLKKRMNSLLERVNGLNAEELPTTNISFMFYFVDDIQEHEFHPELKNLCMNCDQKLQLLEGHLSLHTPPPRFA